MSTEPVVLYTIEEVAKRLRKGDSTYYVTRHKGSWPRVEIGGQTLFTEEHVRQIVEMHTVDPKAPTTTGGLAAGRVTRGSRRT